MTTKKPEALRLADKYEVKGFLQDHRFAQDHWCRQAALELRRLHERDIQADAQIKELLQVIEDLERTAELLSQRVAEMEEQMTAIGAGGVEPLRKADHLRGATKMVPSDHLRDATEMIEKQPSKLSDSEIDAIAEAMPGGLDGFLKGWGWRQFARAVIGAAGGEDALDAAPQQPVPAVQGDALTREQIRDVFLANGFTIKEGLTDLRPYVYDAAYALLARAQAQQGGA